jgi:hypothetical protein
MAPALSNPSFVSFFGLMSVGALVVRCLVMAFAILAAMFTAHQLWRMRRELHIADVATKLYRDQDSSWDENAWDEYGQPKVADQQKKDVWVS